MNPLEPLGIYAKKAAHTLSFATHEAKNRALQAIADALKEDAAGILAANKKDLKKAHKLPPHMLDRLSLEGRLPGVIEDVRKVASLKDPVGEVLEEKTLENGLRLQRQRVPIGVLGVIYEARPNVTCDVAALALKSGNAAILRGGSETIQTNRAIIRAIQKGLKNSGLPEAAIQLIENPRRSQVKQLLHLDKYVDMIIPRGGEGLHHFCRMHSYIPVITGGMGICHLYVEKSADLKKAIPVIVNAKTQRPSVCNALDTLLVDSAIADQFLPLLIPPLLEKGVTFRLDERAYNILQGNLVFQKATPDDWKTEWMSLVLGIKVVDTIDEAIDHIETYSTRHSDGILTESKELAARFVREVDSAATYVNASTRFTDGSEFGLGAEVAISTQKLHARGPMGLESLTTYKWIVHGNYHVRK